VVSFIAGCSTLLLLDYIAKSFLLAIGRFVVALLAATSLPLIYYSTEVKPYALDCAIALALVIVSTKSIDRNSSKLLMLSLVGVMLVWFSFPTIFVLAAIYLLLVASAFASKNRLRLLIAAGAGSIWLLSFGLAFAFTMRHLTRDASLNEYWETGFMPYSREA